MTKEIVTLAELENFGGIARTRADIEGIIKRAKRSNEFYVGTDVAEWLNSLNIVTGEEMIELFSTLNEDDETIEGSYLDYEFEEINWDNSYNWSGHSSCEVDFKIIQSVDNDAVYAYIRVHLGGDVRGNYSDGILVDMDSYSMDYAWSLFENVYEYGNSGYIEIDGVEYSVDGNITNEWLSVYNHETHYSEEVCGGVYCFDKEEFEQELTVLVKEAFEIE